MLVRPQQQAVDAHACNSQRLLMQPPRTRVGAVPPPARGGGNRAVASRPRSQREQSSCKSKAALTNRPRDHHRPDDRPPQRVGVGQITVAVVRQRPRPAIPASAASVVVEGMQRQPAGDRRTEGAGRALQCGIHPVNLPTARGLGGGESWGGRSSPDRADCRRRGREGSSAARGALRAGGPTCAWTGRRSRRRSGHWCRRGSRTYEGPPPRGASFNLPRRVESRVKHARPFTSRVSANPPVAVAKKVLGRGFV